MMQGDPISNAFWMGMFETVDGLIIVANNANTGAACQ
jgi:hypothetical protein